MSDEDTTSKELRVSAQLEAWPEVLSFLEEVCASCGFSRKAIQELTLASEEIFVNIAHYAYPGASGEVHVATSWQKEENLLHLLFEDSGIPYDPLAAQEPDLTLPASERPIGGLGILLAKRLTDRQAYSRQDGQNRLELWKHA